MGAVCGGYMSSLWLRSGAPVRCEARTTAVRGLAAAVQCGRALVQWGLRPGLLVSDFGWCNFCVLDLKKKKKIVKI